jgi:hypothetical protein
MEMNIKLFNQETTKEILFILKDFDPETDNKESIELRLR